MERGFAIHALVVFLAAALVLSAAPRIAFSKSYSYDSINLHLQLFENGSVLVTQERDYNFQGSFSYAYLDLLKKGAQDIKFIGVEDMGTGAQLPYDLVDDSTHVMATWHYSANNEVKKFLVTYMITGAVQRYQDVSELYWKVIEDSHEAIASLSAVIDLPSASPNLFKVFVHSSANPGQLVFSDALKTATVSMRDIPANTFVEFRVLAEPGIFSIQEIPRNEYENILNQEKTNFYFPNITGVFSNIWFYLLLALCPLFALAVLYFKFGREPKVEYGLIYEQEPPMKVPPMALSNFLEGEEGMSENRNMLRGFLATIFDLARRGYLEIKEEQMKKWLGLKEYTEQVFILTKKGHDELSLTKKLTNFEHNALVFIFKHDSNAIDDRIATSEIADYCKKNPVKAREDLKTMDKDARKWFEKNVFPISENASKRVMKYFQSAMLVLLAISGGILFFLNFILGLFMIPTTLISIAGARAISRRTYQSALMARKWKAFKMYISDFSAMKDAPATLLAIWDEYLVYAIVLGVAKNLLENIKKISLDRNVPIIAVPWYHGLSPTTAGTISPEAISTFIDNFTNTMNALSSSTTSGGGFSGGGGGGGGGGGSGAG